MSNCPRRTELSEDRKIRVILVDDDEEDYLLTADMLSDLSRHPYDLEWASNPTEARERIASDPPDICLLDYRLGPVNGISLIPEFLQSGFDGPIIMLTGQRDRDLEDAALAAGAVDYLSKQDVDAYELERALRYAWMRRKAEVHERERLEAETHRREAEAASLAKSEFLAYISHELRTPLAAMLSYADLLSLSQLSGHAAEYASAISRNGRHLQALLDDMLDLSLIESSKLEPDIQDAAIRQVLANVVSTAQVQCKQKNLQFLLDLPPELPDYIATDKKRLTQMLFNLIGNAIKYTESGTVTLRVRYSREPDTIRFEIEDTGPGIRPEDRDLIFQPFQRLEASAENSAGIGLGLTITTRLAAYLGATIDVRSEYGAGTCFSLSLPATDASPLRAIDTDAVLHPDLATTLAGSISGTIAVVDDAVDIRDSISGLLRKVGARALAFGGGRELLTLLDSGDEKPDLILLDMQMPEMDGYEVARQIRTKGFTTPIIALTAAALQGARERCLDAGCDDYLSKPVEPTRLVRRVSEWLRRAAAGTEPSPRTPAAAWPLDILVVDDAQDSREAMRELLSMLNFRVELAPGETEAAAAIDARPPLSVILDLNLGSGSGISLAKRLRQDPGTQGITLIGLSGRAFEELSADERELFDAFMTKPVTMAEILQTLERCGIQPGRSRQSVGLQK